MTVCLSHAYSGSMSGLRAIVICFAQVTQATQNVVFQTIAVTRLHSPYDDVAEKPGWWVGK